jgi:hypothetical protein
LGSKNITSTTATYPTNNLSFGKYRYNFQISDNNSNSSSSWAVFYIDEPELIVSTGSLNIWTLPTGVLDFSTAEITVTVKTVWAWFDLQVSKDSNFSNGTGWVIIDWDGLEWVWYDLTPYSWTNLDFPGNETLATQVENINTDGNKNSYNYSLKIWNFIDQQQAAWNYSMDLSFYIIINY